MSKNFNVEVEFKATGNKQLETAINSLVQAQKNLKNNQVQYNRALTKSNKAIAHLTNKNNALTKSIVATNRAFEVNEKTGNVTVKNNRLLSNSFATLRSKILLVSFAAGLFSASIGRLIKMQGEQELAEKKLSAALGKTSPALLKQASALQQVTGFGDEAILSAQSLLAAFIKDEEQLKLATTATLDLAAAKGMDLNAAADLVGKSIGSSTNALSRYGIVVEGSAGSTLRLESAVKNISRLFGGQAVAQTKTINGQIKIFENNAGDLAEKIGKDLAGSFMPLLQNFNLFIIDLQNGEATFLGMEITVEDLADSFRVLAVAVSLSLNPFAKLQKASVVVRAAITTGRIALGNYVGGLVGLGQGAKDSVEDLEDLSSSIEDVVAAGGLLAFKNEEMIKSEEKLKGTRNKLLDAELKLQHVYSQDKHIMNAAIKVRDSFNKAFGTNIELNKEFTESLDPAKLSLEGLDMAQQNYLITLMKIFDATVALNEVQKEQMETKEKIAAVGQLGQALQTFGAKSKALTIIAIRLQQIAAVADAWKAFGTFNKEGKTLQAYAALAQGLAAASNIEKQLSKAKSAAFGADFIADSPQFIKVGDNPQMRERVTVTPIGSPNVRGGEGASEVVINLNGNILGTEEFVRDTLIPQLENSLGRNLA